MKSNSIKPSAGLKPGDKLDKYDVLEQIAVGGMSTVWKGYDRLVGQTVAIKQIAVELQARGEDSLDAFRHRFRQEAAIQRKISIDQKHLVRVFDFIDDERGLFIVMEYVDGPSLEQIVQGLDEPMETRRALGIIGATCRALQAIHDQNVLHRDLKPSNILLPRDGGLKVCDFGLATVVADQDAQSLGSVRYMAPESFGTGEVDARADIYSLGMVAYELLAGRKAFEEAFRLVLRDQRNQALRWMKWHTNPRTKAPPLHQINPAIEQPLSDLVARMMEKDPTARIESAEQALKAIRRHVTGETEAAAARATVKARAKATAAATAAAHEATALLPRKSRWPWILAAGFIFLGLIGAGVLGYFQLENNAAIQRRIERASAAFDEARSELRDKKNYAAAQAQFLSLAGEWPEHPKFGRESTAFALWAKALEALDRHEYDLAEATLLEVDASGVFTHDRDRIQEQLRLARAGGAFAQEVRVIESMVQKKDFDEARLRLAAQRALTHTEERSKVIEDLGATIEDQAKVAVVDDVLARAQAMAQRGQYTAALALVSDTQRRFTDHRLAEAFTQITRDEQYQSLIVRAQTAKAAGNLDEAVAAYDSALALAPSDSVQKIANQIKSEAAYEDGRRRLAQRDLAGARAAFTRALGYPDIDNALAKEALRQIASADEAVGFVNAGDAAAASGDFEQAIKQYENALAITPDDAVANKLRAVRAQHLVVRGRALLGQHKLDEARQLFLDAQMLVPDQAGVSEGIADVERWSGYLEQLETGDNWRRQSRFGDAIRAYRRAEELMKTPQIRQRIEGVTYDQCVAQARSYLDAKSWDAARAALDLAATLRTTDELRQMYEELQRRNPKPR